MAKWQSSHSCLLYTSLTIDARSEIQTETEREAAVWHEIQNAYRIRHILTGTLDGVEKTASGLTLAVANYKGFRVAIPAKEMMLYTGQAASGQEYAELMGQLNRILNSRLGSEIDFIIKGYDNDTRSAVASRKEAMMRKRQTFYMDADEFGEPMIYEGRVVQARVVAVAEKVIRVEVFGVECTLVARDLSWEWIGNAHDHFSAVSYTHLNPFRSLQPGRCNLCQISSGRGQLCQRCDWNRGKRRYTHYRLYHRRAGISITYVIHGILCAECGCSGHSSLL